MAIILKQISALNKVNSFASLDFEEISSRKVMQGERLAYQVIAKVEGVNADARVRVESDLGDAVKLFVSRLGAHLSGN